jgi:hypothetical protein
MELAASAFTIFVDAIFTTLLDVPFTNVRDVIARIRACTCVLPSRRGD